MVWLPSRNKCHPFKPPLRRAQRVEIPCKTLRANCAIGTSPHRGLAEGRQTSWRTSRAFRPTPVNGFKSFRGPFAWRAQLRADRKVQPPEAAYHTQRHLWLAPRQPRPENAGHPGPLRPDEPDQAIELAVTTYSSLHGTEKPGNGGKRFKSHKAPGRGGAGRWSSGYDSGPDSARGGSPRTAPPRAPGPAKQKATAAAKAARRLWPRSVATAPRYECATHASAASRSRPRTASGLGPATLTPNPSAVPASSFYARRRPGSLSLARSPGSLSSR